MVSFCAVKFLLCFVAAVLLFFIAGLLYLLRFERVDNLGAYSIPSGDRPSHPIWFHQLTYIFLPTRLLKRVAQSLAAVSNLSMGSFRVGSVGLKAGAVALALFVVTGFGWRQWLRFRDHKITDQQLLREAVAEWKRAGEPGNGPDYQIFEQQAAQGYYDDAAATAAFFKRADDQKWSVAELAKIRAENGDIEGSKAMVQKFAGSDLATSTMKAIAFAQVGNGDLQGALETAAPLAIQDEVLLAFARHQIASGDLDGALRTAERMKSDWWEVFYDVGAALRLRAEQERVRELASHMRNPKLAAEFRQHVRLTLWLRGDVKTLRIEVGPCDIAYHDASIGNFTEADFKVEQNKCPYVSGVTTPQYAVDPVGAERLLRAQADRKDLATGLADFATLAANKGDISEALRFFYDLQQVAGVGSADKVAHDLARAWTIRDGPNVVLKWTTSRPTTGQRTWALIGMAEALGHARQTR